MKKELRYKLLLPEWTTTDQGLVKLVLEKEMGLSRHEISRLKFDGEILLNEKPVHVDAHMNVGDELVVRFKEDVVAPVEEDTLNPEILYEEEDFVIVNKPAGVPIHPSTNHLEDSLGTALQAYYQKQGQSFVIRPVGRLDQDVSGICLFAKNQIAAARLNEEIENKSLKKEYVAYAQGIFHEKQGTIDAPIEKIDGHLEREVNENGQPAITHYEVLKQCVVNDKDVSKVHVTLDTGRTHQIRAHLKSIGHPLLGDGLYGGDESMMKRPALHCEKISFTSPFTKKRVQVSCPMPKDMVEIEGEPVVQPLRKEEQAVLLPTWKDRLGKVAKYLLALLLLGLVGCGGFFGYRYYQNQSLAKKAEQEKAIQALEDSLTIHFPSTTTFEYGSDFDAKDYAKDHTGELTLLQGIDTKRVGVQKLRYQLTIKDEKGNEATKEIKQEITIKDTKKPEIKFEKETIQVPFGEFFDANENIVSVSDPVDGALQEATTLGKGKYVLTNPVDNRKEGTYEVEVEAMDQNENTTKASYQVIVGSGVTPTPTPTPTATTNKDQTKPYILIRKDEIVIQEGEAYDPKSNIIYVTDETDGELAYKEKEEKGSYTLTHNLDTKKAGKYEVKVIATDQAGNQELDDFVVVVEAKPQEPTPTPTPTPVPTPSAAPTSAPTGVNPEDKTKPYILIRRDEAFVVVGNSYDPKTNIIYVTDETDGELGYSDKEEPGSYTIQHSINTNEIGSYNARIIATDRAGNKEYDDFVVTVRDASQIQSKTFDPGSNAEYIFNYITGTIGLNKAAAYGIMANMQRESGYTPTADNGMGYYGLCQWGGGRNTNLINWCGENGLEYWTLDGQLAFMNMELNNIYTGCFDTLRNVEDSGEGAYQAGYAFGMYYEVAGEFLSNSAGNLARNFYNNE